MSRMLFLRDIDVDVLMRCRACGHEGTLPRADLERRFGSGYPVLSLAPHFRCSQCNSRDVESRPLPTPDGPVLETMVDKAATAEVEDRFQSTLAALRGLVDAAHDTDDDGPPREPGPPPLGSMMDALRGLTGGAGEEDGEHGDEGAPVIPPSQEPHAPVPPAARSFAPMEPAPRHDGDGGDDFLKELARISRLMGDDDPPPAPAPAPPPAPAPVPVAEDEGDDWLPALFRDGPPSAAPPPASMPPASMPPASMPAEVAEDDGPLDLAAFDLADPAMDGADLEPAFPAPRPVPDDDPADGEDGLVDDAPPPAHLTDTLAALRSMIQSAAKDAPPDEDDGRPVPPPPARPDFRYHADDGEDGGEDEGPDLPEPAFGVPAHDPGPATDQDLSALKAMVEKAERDADRSTSAADIASVIPPDFRPPFWVETGLDRVPPPAAGPPATPPAVAAPAPDPAPEPPRRKGSFLSRLRRRRAETHHPAAPEPEPPPAPAPMPEPPPPSAVPPPDDAEPSAETLNRRLAALKALLAGEEAASPSGPPPAPESKAAESKAPASKSGWGDDDILDLEAFAEDEPAPPPAPPADAADDDFRRVLFNRLREEKEHPHQPSVPPGEGRADEDIPLEDILSFTARGQRREEEPPPRPAFGTAAPPGHEEPEPEEEPAPADFGRFAIRDPDILFARSHREEDDEPPASYLWDEPEPFEVEDREPERPAPPPPPKTEGPEAEPRTAVTPRPDAESYARTLAALRGILGGQGTGGEEDDPSPRGGRRRKKKSI